jgi:CBS domain-containing protein
MAVAMLEGQVSTKHNENDLDTRIPRCSTVADVMSRQSFCVRPSTSLREVVDIMSTHDLYALPVVDGDGRAVGVVSATDLLAREQAIMPLPRHPWANGAHVDHQDGHLATQARSIMSTPALTIPVDAPVAFAARRLQDGGVRQLVAVDDDGKVMGMVSRSDLLRVFRRTDADIRRDIADGVITRWLHLDASRIAVSVNERVVVLSGHVDSAADRRLLLELTGGVEGVLDVISAITVDGSEAAASGWTSS